MHSDVSMVLHPVLSQLCVPVSVALSHPIVAAVVVQGRCCVLLRFQQTSSRSLVRNAREGLLRTEDDTATAAAAAGG